jgi:hypothetical protein
MGTSDQKKSQGIYCSICNQKIGLLSRLSFDLRSKASGVIYEAKDKSMEEGFDRKAEL